MRKGLLWIGKLAITTGEDTELSWRLRRRGGPLVFVPNAVTQLRRVTPLAYFSHQFDRGKGIALMFLSHRSSRISMAPQESLLWNDAGRRRGNRWVNVFRRKIIGPFDVGNFDSVKDFAVFWVGEKVEGAGFVWQIVARPQAKSV